VNAVNRINQLIAMLDGIIQHSEDHVLIMNIGPAESFKLSVVSLGKEFETAERQPVIV